MSRLLLEEKLSAQLTDEVESRQKDKCPNSRISNTSSSALQVFHVVSALRATFLNEIIIHAIYWAGAIKEKAKNDRSVALTIGD